MGQIRTAVRAYTTVGQAPEEVMRSTNRLLLDLGADLFASCLYLRLDPAHGRAVMSRAGHPPPLLRRPDGRVRVLDLAGGPLLGIDASAVYPTTEVALAPGSLLVLYTDGLVESPGTDFEEALADLGQAPGRRRGPAAGRAGRQPRPSGAAPQGRGGTARRHRPVAAQGRRVGQAEPVAHEGGSAGGPAVHRRPEPRLRPVRGGERRWAGPVPPGRGGTGPARRTGCRRFQVSGTRSDPELSSTPWSAS